MTMERAWERSWAWTVTAKRSTSRSTFIRFIRDAGIFWWDECSRRTGSRVLPHWPRRRERLPFITARQELGAESGFSAEGRVAEAGDEVIVDQSDGLHKRVADGGTDEVEAAMLEVFAHVVALCSAGRDLLERTERVDARPAADELPDVAVEGSELFLNFEEGLGVGDGGANFQFVADDAVVVQQRGDFALVEAGYALGVKLAEGGAVVFALAQDRVPTESGLGAFEDEEFKQMAVIVRRHAPFLVVVEDGKVVRSPGAAGEGAGHVRYSSTSCGEKTSPPRRSLDGAPFVITAAIWDRTCFSVRRDSALRPALCRTRECQLCLRGGSVLR